MTGPTPYGGRPSRRRRVLIILAVVVVVVAGLALHLTGVLPHE